ncbi:MAG: hypothetical protein A2499_03245 [Stygiobacter sp. RIFOXYC12_FULL_38_8]|nr:MAG: hypothetical protein A2440_06490 [Stygiobacter sp. RIFOXYC2_FULL_38_25]OGV17911.1 MAG: hypothetical protein A2237_03275 [Stygiobacter sp. RIFOXYA2_FULL_38_8]OGV22125.1 MAG: hypothetical protein A2499_03245 [Stygiobacter sp. RIFOXYC12_FULL_38_8]OGV79567.1 MAG: hypothetical protein A2X65_18570 [Stygiobacter sp. GWF2_38_21]
MDIKPERKILLNPGPATTSDAVKYAQIVPDICPRENDFSEIVEKIRTDLKKIINANKYYTTVLFGGSGTAAMEAVLSSVVSPNKKVLILINGAYGERFKKIAETHLLDHICLKSEWGQPLNFLEAENILKSENDIGYIVMVHHETSTGILNPIEKFSQIAQKYMKVSILDAISSFAAIPINVQKTPIDYLISTSNKCIQGMAGISFVFCLKDKLDLLKSTSPRTVYLNLYEQYSSLEQSGQFQFTPPVQTIYALKQAISEFFNEGADCRFQRYKENYKILKDGLLKLGFRVFVTEADESNILITVLEPKDDSYNFKKMHDALFYAGFTIYPGKVSNLKTFRLAVMGDLKKADIECFLLHLKKIIQEMKIKLIYD